MNLLNHVALLCRSVERAAAKLRAMGFEIGAREIFEGEGTAEIYVGGADAKRGLILLMEPVAPGAYERAMKRRGPGLHHIAVDVPAIAPFLAEIARSGWLLHPNSLTSHARHRTVYLIRPGFPAIIEIQEREGHATRLQAPALVTGLRLATAEARAENLLACLGLAELRGNPDGRSQLQLGQLSLDIQDLTHA